MAMIYCVKCRKPTISKDVREEKTAADRDIVRAVCGVCGTKKSRFGKLPPEGVETAT